jgi:hypothetical protein
MQCVMGQSCVALSSIWRIEVALGAVPGLAVVFLRSFLPETPRFLVHIVQPRLKAARSCRNRLEQAAVRKDPDAQLALMMSAMRPGRCDSAGL